MNYIKGKIFIDAGAYIGDSALVLAGYSPSKIFSFDISERNGTCLKRTMAENGLPSSKVEFVRAALADKCGKMAFFDSGYAGTSLAASGQNECDVTTLDAFTKTRTEKIGFIKADLEGMAYEMTLGMLETLKRDRPVLSLAIYHSIDEFYGIRKLLGEQLENYTYRVVGLNHAPAKEIVLFAWPNEVMPSKNWWWD